MSTKVMLIDDSATVRLQASRALTEAGFSVVEAVDGVDALEKLSATDDIQLIVCDVNMPRMGGIELIETLFNSGKGHPPVIMLTTEGHPELIRQAKACGAKGWMVKPFKPDLLVAAVRKLTALPLAAASAA